MLPIIRIVKYCRIYFFVYSCCYIPVKIIVILCNLAGPIKLDFHWTALLTYPFLLYGNVYYGFIDHYIDNTCMKIFCLIAEYRCFLYCVLNLVVISFIIPWKIFEFASPIHILCELHRIHYSTIS